MTMRTLPTGVAFFLLTATSVLVQQQPNKLKGAEARPELIVYLSSEGYLRPVTTTCARGCYT